MDHANRRKYFRMRIVAHARWRVLNDEDTKLVKKGMGRTLFRQNDFPSPIDEFLEQTTPGSGEEQLYRCIQLINNKLDFIIDQISLKSMEDDTCRNDVIEVSGSGLKFITKEHLKADTFLKMDLIMPGTFQYQLELIAGVVRVDKKDDGFTIAARIIEIDEESRNSIIKVVFQKQRKEIRREKMNQGDQDAG